MELQVGSQEPLYQIMLARYYSSSLGRFMAVDPMMKVGKNLANPQRWNRYTYTLNNPINFFDPNGMEECTVQIRAFIAQPSVGGYTGDNRGFSSAPDASSRVSVTVRIETDPARNGGNPMIGTPQVQVSRTHFNIDNVLVGEGQASGPMMPQVSATQGEGGVTVGVDMNVRNPLAPLGGGIRTDLNVTMPQDASTAQISGTTSASPSFEANITCEGGETQNVPLQSESPGVGGFGVQLQRTHEINKKVEIKK